LECPKRRDVKESSVTTGCSDVLIGDRTETSSASLKSIVRLELANVPIRSSMFVVRSEFGDVRFAIRSCSNWLRSSRENCGVTGLGAASEAGPGGIVRLRTGWFLLLGTIVLSREGPSVCG
jgi:hypothetical protein